MTDREDNTVNYYDRNAQDWVASHIKDKNKSFWRDEIKRFKEILPAGKILEVGSGGGNDAAELIASGFDYVGTDASIGLLELARKKNPGARFEHVRVHDLNFQEGEFDGFYTSATLLHIGKDRIDDALQKIKHQVKKGGIGFISIKKGDGEKVDKETGRHFSYYQPDEFSGILERNGYETIEMKIRETDRDDWLCFYVRTT